VAALLTIEEALDRAADAWLLAEETADEASELAGAASEEARLVAELTTELAKDTPDVPAPGTLAVADTTTEDAWLRAEETAEETSTCAVAEAAKARMTAFEKYIPMIGIRYRGGLWRMKAANSKARLGNESRKVV
jgi:hypothetical protein